ncbi:MAG: GNAT family N-acetyltransferase [Candidatus Margulisbacteria bacterium GWF2_38_17]|nr:MAG: GNAT family N-acetyltransferase [Candidatus Margulisbacteria bacterium GWD2_39_127]OGI05569.1 MAG: GNAT family N-acetyltransferase [Candidatus Margulisbacteria bacterium GWF2_38_17]OGI09497.1 MAG: GNAT family N-acetyltransferase [Candidatus Margulisbacteria bacterium GWE2_39_32]
MKIRKANTSDSRAIFQLIKCYADCDLMLFKPLFEIYESIRDFYVIEENNEIVACCALELYWEGLGEIRSLAVKEDFHGKGLGKKIVEACTKEAIDLKIEKVFALTYKEKFFAKLGFNEVDKNDMPQKIWAQCVNCSKFPDCNEICMIKDL